MHILSLKISAHRPACGAQLFERSFMHQQVAGLIPSPTHAELACLQACLQTIQYTSWISPACAGPSLQPVFFPGSSGVPCPHLL